MIQIASLIANMLHSSVVEAISGHQKFLGGSGVFLIKLKSPTCVAVIQLAALSSNIT